MLKRLIKSVTPEPYWNKLKLWRETVRNRKYAKQIWRQIKEKRRPLLNYFDKRILEHLKNQEAETILEIGSETGRLTYWLVYNNYSVVGIEPDKWYRRRSSEFLQEMGIIDIRIIDGDVQNLPFSDNSFDIVICAAVIEHVQDPPLAIKEMVRCAKKSCLVVTPVEKSFDSPDHKHYFSENDIERLFKGLNYSKKVFHNQANGVETTDKAFFITVKS